MASEMDATLLKFSTVTGTITWLPLALPQMVPVAAQSESYNTHCSRIAAALANHQDENGHRVSGLPRDYALSTSNVRISGHEWHANS